ncbi:unnamed protein product [Ixodes persulcatus]
MWQASVDKFLFCFKFCKCTYVFLNCATDFEAAVSLVLPSSISKLGSVSLLQLNTLHFYTIYSRNVEVITFLLRLKGFLPQVGVDVDVRVRYHLICIRLRNTGKWTG